MKNSQKRPNPCRSKKLKFLPCKDHAKLHEKIGSLLDVVLFAHMIVISLCGLYFFFIDDAQASSQQEDTSLENTDPAVEVKDITKT